MKQSKCKCKSCLLLNSENLLQINCKKNSHGYGYYKKNAKKKDADSYRPKWSKITRPKILPFSSLSFCSINPILPIPALYKNQWPKEIKFNKKKTYDATLDKARREKSPTRLSSLQMLYSKARTLVFGMSSAESDSKLSLHLISRTFLCELECTAGQNVGLAAGRYSGNSRPDL